MKKKPPPENATLELLGWVRFLKMARERYPGVEEMHQDFPDLPFDPRADPWSIRNSETQWAARRIRDAERYLEQHGWRMNAAGKVTRIRKGRGADFLAECVWEIYTTKYQDKGNTPSVRRKISRELEPFSVFEESELSPMARAAIHTAIYDREKRRR